MSTVYTLLPLHRAFHVACAWPNSKYEDINEILYRPSIVPGGGALSPPPRKTATAFAYIASDCWPNDCVLRSQPHFQAQPSTGSSLSLVVTKDLQWLGVKVKPNKTGVYMYVFSLKLRPNLKIADLPLNLGFSVQILSHSFEEKSNQN